MKLNYLSIALATALATTLTACGSDNSSNYNQPTVSPAPQTKPGTPENKPGTPENNKPQTPETKPEGDANKKPEGDANKKPDGDAGADKKPEGDANKKPEGDANKKPEAPQPEDKKINPGNAANPGDITTDNYVVAQNYIRGAASSFDKKNNPDKIGNASVVGFNELNNEYMSNIILGRVRAKDGKKLTNIYAGEDPGQVDNNSYQANGTIDGLQQNRALQHLNDTAFIGTSGLFTNPVKSSDSTTTNNFKPSKSLEEATNAYDKAAKKHSDADLKATALKAAAEAAAKDGASADKIKAAATQAVAAKDFVSGIARQLKKKVSEIDLTKSEVQNTKAYKKAQEIANKAIQGINTTAAAYTQAAATAATQATEAKVEADKLQAALNTAIAANVKDQAASAPIADHSKLVTDYGSLFYRAGLVRAYQPADNEPKANPSDNQDKTFYVRGQENPIFTIDKDGNFVVTNVTGSPADATGATAASDDVRMFGSLSKPDDVPARKWNAITKKFEANKGNATTPNSWQFDVDNRNTTIKQRAERNQTVTLHDAIVPTSLHLDHVQYGRVTANADAGAITALTTSSKDGVKFHQFSTIKKLNEQDKASAADFNKNDTTIDYYFARGLEPTEKMPTEGTINYLGHALTYGLDNSFHGDDDPNNSNAARLTPRHAIGNFVAATLDTATKKVTGSIYNVWTNNAGKPNEGVVKDNLVTFDGAVQGNTNSVLGDAKLAYTPADSNTPTTASFRGGFFGANASELAGNINTTKEGYGDTAWGAVFGAKAPAAATPGLDFENQAEVQKTAPATK